VKKLALITPRYGANVGAGAEVAARGFAESLTARGWHVEVWTTCVTSTVTWENTLPAGTDIDNGVVVTRFPITPGTYPDASKKRTLELHSEAKLPPEYDWLIDGEHSPELYHHIAQHGDSFDIIMPKPYTFRPALYAVWIHPEKTMFWPCLHHEVHAYMEPIRLALERAASVRFNSPEGQDLAVNTLGFQLQNSVCISDGVQFQPLQQVETVTHSIPHLLYVGRLEQEKNVLEMYRFVQLYAENVGDIHLTIVGKGPITPPKLPYIDYRGFVSEQEKAELYTTSTAHWLPSISESFSLVTMESWLSGRPALVNRDCYAPAGHVQRSKGGLAYRGFWELAGAVQWLHQNPHLATRMGHNGKRYVEQNFTWPVILDRFEAAVTEWIPSTQ